MAEQRTCNAQVGGSKPPAGSLGIAYEASASIRYMPLVRVSQADDKRVFDFKAWHAGLDRMVKVKTCNFASLDGEAELVIPDTGVSFKAKMRELVLLQDTNLASRDNTPVFEGDVVQALVMNIFGSWEEVVGEVFFDDGEWGYSITPVSASALPLTGDLQILAVVGNVFEGIDETKLIDPYEQEEHNKKG